MKGLGLFYALYAAALFTSAAPAIIFQLPAILWRGVTNPYSALFCITGIAVSFVIWQASIVSLALCDPQEWMERRNKIIILNFVYVVVDAMVISIFFVFPAMFF